MCGGLVARDYTINKSIAIGFTIKNIIYHLGPKYYKGTNISKLRQIKVNTHNNLTLDSLLLDISHLVMNINEQVACMKVPQEEAKINK